MFKQFIAFGNGLLSGSSTSTSSNGGPSGGDEGQYQPQGGGDTDPKRAPTPLIRAFRSAPLYAQICLLGVPWVLAGIGINGGLWRYGKGRSGALTWVGIGLLFYFVAFAGTVFLHW